MSEPSPEPSPESLSEPLPDVHCLRCEQLMPDPFTPCPACSAEGVMVNGTTAVPASLNVAGHDIASHALAAAILPPGIERRPPTPLTRMRRAGEYVGATLWVKDERLNPSFSYKDRLADVAAARAIQAGYHTMVLSSSGNHGAAVARAATAAGLRAVVFTIPTIAPAMRRLIEGCGGQLCAVEQAEDRWRMVQAAIKQLGWFPASNFHNPPIGSSAYLVDGYQPIAWEITEQLGGVPDWVAVPVGYGDGISGVAKGFRTLMAAGLTDRLPRMLAVETTGTLVEALGSGTDLPPARQVVAPNALSIASPQGTYQALHAVRSSAGDAVTVTDQHALDARTALSRLEGAFHELSSAAAVAGVASAVEKGLISADEAVVAVGTSGGFKDQLLPGEDDQPLDAVPTTVVDDVCSGSTPLESVIPRTS